ncbi:hypothetical protein OIE62_04900 [Streptomyces scopuliridis]|uniref:Uncharacterized protein n=1 Tax=Streptomyces scopuliridis TaxID=452529 RepID=A0ACD4ZW67_9ACTN|nr:hypothetical protein [Streptomyces scopuliridis]WSC02038.1 hypothetical protein OG835_36930 [Streptomyces scopuliridis]WSC04425.1 hypothetical protein OIE62_04900 [Streptomyces scopuliridis]
MVPWAFPSPRSSPRTTTGTCWAAAALGTVVAVLVVLLVPESKVRTGGRSDLTGAAGLTIGLVCLLLPASKAEDWGWAGATTLFATAAIIPLPWGWFQLRVILAHRTIDFDGVTLPPRNGPRTVLAIGGCRRRLPGLRALHPRRRSDANSAEVPAPAGPAAGTPATDAE